MKSLPQQIVRGLFGSFSPFLAIESQKREGLLDELERIAREEFNGEVHRTMTTRLYTAQRKN